MQVDFLKKEQRYSNNFTLQTDLQALLLALKNNRGNKKYQSRLRRWFDRLLPVHFKVENIAGQIMGFEKYLRRHSSSSPTDENIDEDHVKIKLMAVNYTLHTTHRKLTNQNARKVNTYNDVRFQSK